jgi:hypothetical protein
VVGEMLATGGYAARLMLMLIKFVVKCLPKVVTQLVKKYPVFTENEGSLTCLQKFVTGQPTKSIDLLLHRHVIILQN